MSNFKQIENLLPTLTLEELKELKKRITYFARCLASSKRDDSSSAPKFKQTDLTNYIEQELLYSEFSKVFASEIAPEFAFFLAKSSKAKINAFLDMDEWMRNFFNSFAKDRTRVDYMQFCHFCIQILIDDLKTSTLPVCFRVILVDKRWELLPSLIDSRFPGYGQNKEFLVKILVAIKNRHKDE